MTTAAYEVKRGSLVVVSANLEDAQALELANQLRQKCGHDRFVVLTVPPEGDAVVYGPDDLEGRPIPKGGIPPRPNLTQGDDHG